jgi:hypothetical protein
VRLLKELRLVLCLTIVAAIEGRLAARSTISEDVVVPGGTASVAASLGIDPVPDRARFAAEITRLVYDIPAGRNTLADARLERVHALMVAPSHAEDDRTELVPIPLTTALWSQAVFHRPLTNTTVFTAILGDRDASLVCRGLAALDDETLAFFAEHPALVTRLHERSATAFGGFSRALRIRGGRVVTPGGPDAVRLWEAVVGEPVDKPERFVRELFEQREGRVAYVYDTVADTEPARQEFALGLWMNDPHARVDRFKALVAATSDSYRDWHVKVFPFARPLSDLATLVARVRIDERGRPMLASRAFWARVFEAGGGDDAAPADCAWLADVILTKDLQIRVDRLDQFAFGQRVFAAAGAGDMASVDEAVRAFPKTRALMLSLERIGITSPATYAAAARHASRLSALDGERAFVALAQFQGVLAILVRLARVQSLEPPKIAALLDSLLASDPGRDGHYGGAIVAWLDRSLAPALTRESGLEATIVSGLAGPNGRTVPAVAWEGQQYRLDLVAAERTRLVRIREKQESYTLDAALALQAAAARVARADAGPDQLREVADSLKSIAAVLGSAPRIDPSTLPPGVGAAKSPREIVERAVRDLAKNDSSKRASTAESLAATSDRVAAEALASIAYAIDIGDPDSAVLLAGNVAVRHDFGIGTRDGAARARVEWSIPRPDVAPGAPWRVRGSLLGLDIGLSSLALRRINSDRVVGAPALTSNEREAFAASLAMMNAFALRDEERDAIAEAIARGRSRVRALTSDGFDAVAAAVGMDGWRVRAGRWMLARPDAAASVPSLFSATELARLGGGTSSPAFDEWGMSAFAWEGCLCLQLAPPGSWVLWTGRPQLGLLASNVADLNFRIAEALHDMRLPAPLARYVLAGAVQDYIDEVQPTDANDWMTLVRSAQTVNRERIEDYVAAAAAVDGPLIPQSARGAAGLLAPYGDLSPLLP